MSPKNIQPLFAVQRCKSFFILFLFLLGVSNAFVVNQNKSNNLSTHAKITTRSNNSILRRNDDNIIQLRMFDNNDDGKIKGADRIFACIPYLLPLLDGDHFGRYIYQRISVLGTANAVLIQPLERIYEQIPFGSVIFFFALTLGTRAAGGRLSKGVKFNAQQAALIDIFLVFPELAGAVTGGMNLPMSVMEPSSTFVFYTYMAMCLYSIQANIRGIKPNQIPVVSGAAEMNSQF